MHCDADRCWLGFFLVEGGMGVGSSAFVKDESEKILMEGAQCEGCPDLDRVKKDRPRFVEALVRLGSRLSDCRMLK
jgi:hypothetical protein